MKEVAEDDEDSSDISGYHSDSDSAIMMSGNSPYVSKRARYNFLTRSVRSSSKSSVRTSVLLSHQLSSSSGVSNGSMGHCSDSPSNSLSPTTEGSKALVVASPDTCSTSSSNSNGNSSSNSGANRPRQLKHKKDLHKLNSAASTASSGTLACCQGCEPRASLQVLPPSSDQEVSALRTEMETLRAELSRANMRAHMMQESERQLRERLASTTAVTATISEGELGSLVGERLVRCYSNLYTSARVDTLDALDNLPPLKDADELKSKILFSVIVLAFRSAQSLLALKKDHVRRILHIPAPPLPGAVQLPLDPIAAELEQSVAMYLRRTVENFDLSKSVEEVCSQIWATLYDYPCLKSCPGLVQYVKNAMRLAWGLVNQTPPFVLEYEQRVLRKDVHVRFHASDPDSDQIRTYLWPALLEGPGGPCVHKAVVIT